MSTPGVRVTANPPDPGSDAAIWQGCTCAVIDNCHGRVPPIPPGAMGLEDGGWYITEGCPLHDKRKGPGL